MGLSIEPFERHFVSIECFSTSIFLDSIMNWLKKEE